MVDDKKPILETYPPLLRNLGYYIRTASHKAEALQLISEDKFNIVFLDQFLGPCIGLDLLAEMSAINPELYYVIITGNDSADLAVECLKRGAADFISKPFFITDLIKSIDHVNRKRELDRQKKEILKVLEQKVIEKTEELKNVYFSVLASLAQTMEKKDMGTYGHSRRVAHFSELIAAVIGLKEKDQEDLKAAALLHDLGKIGISDFILGKSGSLNEKEMDAVRSHPQKGVEILKPLKQFSHILPAILHHHESYDGSGYPAGLAGEEIPIFARIIATADAYDAILSNRPYRSGRNHDYAVRELLKYSSQQFDPQVVNAFVEASSIHRHLFEYSQTYEE